MKRLLALLCALSGSLILAEALYGAGYRQNIPHITAAAHVSARAEPVDAPAVRSWDQWQMTVLSRPLFSPDRRPAAGSVAADAGLPRLTGVIASPGDAVAIFQPTGNGKPMVLRHGETVGGWEVTRITADAVSLRKAMDRLVLQPAFGNSRTGAAKAIPEPPPSRWEAAAATGVLRARWSNPQLQP